MKQLTVAEIRETFLRFFERHQHQMVPSSSLVVTGDPTLLFTNSGMVQFKDTFLGLEQRPYRRATTAQKCLRVSGKHNDLEEVGPSPRHHTFFEMLGNFSFGDYFKADAIQMAWELLTQEFGIPVERMWFTIYEGDDAVPADEEAARLWEQVGAPPERILRFGRKDNFWVMADTGPCGPCSEITVYLGDDLSKMRPDGVNSDDPDYVEIWNLVFMQFERSTMEPLPRPSVDTGMGLERMAMVLQGVHSTYETDVFRTIIGRITALLGTDEAHYREHFAAYRAIADHSRAVAFLIADGVLPGNNGRSYVLRRILRRAVYQGRSIGFAQPFLTDVVATVIDDMQAAYPQLAERRQFILDTVTAEEAQFLRTLAGGLVKLDTLIAQLQAAGSTIIPGDEAFRLKDTDGFPLDLTQKIASERGVRVDVAGFEQALAAQRERSRAAAQFKRGADAELWGDHDLPNTVFTGYSALSGTSPILAMVVAGDDVSTATVGQVVQVVLAETPFYAESGGQVGDTGTLRGAHGTITVTDTQKPIPGLIVHYGTVSDGTVTMGETVTATVDAARRGDIQRNHTATHLLHRALRDVLGEHAAQAGSLVAPDRLRFDFTHTAGLSPDELTAIEQCVNEWIRADGRVTWQEMPYQQAIDNGAMALFGEKYGDVVRVVTVERGDGTSEVGAAFATRDSVELCGGTHVSSTGTIGTARLLGESGIGSGVRRIEMLTGRGADTWVSQRLLLLDEIAARLKVAPEQTLDRLDSLLGGQKTLQQELDALRRQVLRAGLDTLLANVIQQNGVALLASEVEAPDVASLRELGDMLKHRMGSGVVVLGSVINERPQLLVMVSDDLVQQGYHAGNLIKQLAAAIGGGGGGKPDMAQAGGRDATQLGAAIAAAAPLLADQPA